jgi:DMSO/TMAO reductase YedYZ molybdopterin-dependent catalytic subunit
MPDRDLSNTQGKIQTAKIMKKLGKGLGLKKGNEIKKKKNERLPPGQYLLHDPNEFPILDLGFRPHFDPNTYRFIVDGLVENLIDISFTELINKFPKTELTSDFHCVTKWSKLDVKWGGIKYLDLQEYIKPTNNAKFVLQHGLDDYTTNVPIDILRKDNVLLAYELFGKPLTNEHGAPLRLIIPDLYAWKGAKFLYKLNFLEADRPGFWEVRGYHNQGDPWQEERYG